MNYWNFCAARTSLPIHAVVPTVIGTNQGEGIGAQPRLLSTDVQMVQQLMKSAEDNFEIRTDTLAKIGIFLQSNVKLRKMTY